ncbi:MAG: DUF6502 family protein [Pseudomonadota bacterium]
MRVLRGLIRPLVRTLIARGITAPAFYRLLKRVYVEVADAEFRIDAAPPTDSRVSLLTGVHRKDVREIRGSDEPTWEATRSKTATFATVLGQWLSRPSYLNADGSPRPLPRTGDGGADFESLVRSVSRDIRPRTVLDELLRQRLVHETEDGLLEVAGDAVLGPSSDDHKIVFFAANVGDHLAAAAENLLTEDPPFLERAVFYNRMSGASIDQIEARARILSQSMLQELNSESASLQAADREAAGGGERFRFGVYFYREGDAPAGEDRKEDS